MLISINLSNCMYLKQIPDLSRVPNLESLILDGCKRLSKVHPSIGELKKLVMLNLKGCESLKSISSQCISLESLEIFILSGCKKLTRFPEIVGNMDRLYELHLDETAIKELPISVMGFSGLTLLSLKDCKNLLKLPDEICSLTSLKILDITGCSHIEQLPKNIGRLEQLEKLVASGTAMRNASPSITLLKNLKILCFSKCSKAAHTSWDSVFSCCLLPMEESIHFQLPNSLHAYFISLTSLCLRKCNLSEEGIPEDISCLSSLQRLDLGENNFVSLPDSISQLNLAVLFLEDCKRLEWLPKLPLSLTHAYVHGCPQLKILKEEIWTSDRGFTFIHYENSYQIENSLISNEELFQMLYSKILEASHYTSYASFFVNIFINYFYFLYILFRIGQDNIYNGEVEKFGFECTRIPEWCRQQNIGYSTRIQLPLEDTGKAWMGFATFAVFQFQEGDILRGDGELSACFHFDTNKGHLGFEHFDMENRQISGAGPYGVWIYVPRDKFGQNLNKASGVAASISTHGSHINVYMCGMHIVFNEDMPDFCRKIAQLLNESTFLTYKIIRKPMVVAKFETPRGAIEFQSDPLKRVREENYRSNTESDLDRKTTRDLQWLVTILVQRCYAHNYCFAFHFPLKAFPTWFFHHSVASSVVCDVPMNLFDEKPWVGFCLYVQLTWPNNYLDSQTPLHLGFQFQVYGDDGDMCTIEYTIAIKHKLILLTMPRVYIRAVLNQCPGVRALFTTSNPDVEVELCGIRPVNEQDLGNLIQLITDITLSSGHFCYEEFGQLFEESPSAVEFVEPKVEIPIDFDYYDRQGILERDFIRESLKEILASNKGISYFPFTLREKVGRPRLESSYQVIPVCTPKESYPACINLQIVAENALKVSDPIKWQRRIEESLEQLIEFDVVIALILKGHIISVLKPFHPFSNYNFCFPQKEILDWFEGYQVKDRSMKIKVPSNLNDDENWRGIAVCVSFSIHEHPTIMLDYKSLEFSFQLKCDLKTEEHCFPPAKFLTNKFKFTWLCIRRFIWLTYIPSNVFAGHLNKKNYLKIVIFNNCPDVVARHLGARFLYQQDVEELKQSIAKCSTSFFDNLDPIRQIMTHQHRESFFHFNHGCLKHLAEIAAYRGFENENPSLAARTESNYLRKGGLEFEQDMIYDSCFPLTEILDWFGHQNSGSSVTIQLPSYVYSDGNWIGLALCAYFSDLQHSTTSLDQEFHLKLTSQIKTEKVGIESQHEFEITNEELKKLNSGEFIWVSYIPRLWFSDQLNQCSLIEASFASGRQELSSSKCGLRLLYQHDEEEFKQTISHCMALLSDSISDSFTQEPSTRRTGRTTKQPERKDKGYRVGRHRIKVEIPPNLNGAENWRGIAVYVISFSVDEHPIAILDHKSIGLPFGLDAT
ncbi:hypothetical protein FEM48_Zijuj11G0071700 [Ziziphus jujuba var. spinosa]|uniref:Disease resistance-like protein DSC1 n=1 Tax=Ziziphus jujuba var. spinosa TaxID=714518 RepID=A0A978UHJ7_ZIZJJ|nr:hypothetical protein FEM48_Zijuj11G0071700 [Ziziphus jujuba var. spinosa]